MALGDDRASGLFAVDHPWHVAAGIRDAALADKADPGGSPSSEAGHD